VSEWLSFNANSAIFQLYHGEIKLISLPNNVWETYCFCSWDLPWTSSWSAERKEKKKNKNNNNKNKKKRSKNSLPKFSFGKLNNKKRSKNNKSLKRCLLLTIEKTRKHDTRHVCKTVKWLYGYYHYYLMSHNICLSATVFNRIVYKSNFTW
jgi:hypothetical protein